MRRIAYITASWEDESGTRERVFDDELLYEDVSYWILYDGKKVTIYQGEYGDKENSKIYFQLNGTSGGLDYQFAFNQNVPQKGPVPEGDYEINLELDPSRKVIMNSNGETNQNTGLEQLLTEDDLGNLAWGRWRARLEKVNVNTARDNFYFHDSYKGFSHGCIETESALYYFFYSLHAHGYKTIKVKVAYISSDTKTNGGTKTTPFRLPENVKPILNRYQPLPKGDPKRIPWLPWPIDEKYEFTTKFYELKSYAQ